MENIHWAKSGDIFSLNSISNNIGSELPAGIYQTEYDSKTQVYNLRRTADSFVFPYKIYGIETEFIRRVLKTYNNTVGNTGILLSGVKGTGKTITAELLCNEMKLPIILVTNVFPPLAAFIASIPCDCVVFFDEYEKLFGGRGENVGIVEDDMMLSIMDGALSNEVRKMFILTTNSSIINVNMIERPGRIRYLKEFDDLSLDLIKGIVKDILVNDDLFDKVVEFISELNTVTVDIVKAIVEECNIHNETPEKFENVFNVQKKKATVQLFEYFEEDKSWEEAGVMVDSPKPLVERKGRNLYLNDNYTCLGSLQKVISDVEFETKQTRNGKIIVRHFKLDVQKTYHKSFTGPWVLTI